MCGKICDCLVSPLGHIPNTCVAYVQDTSTSRKITDLVISVLAGLAVTVLVMTVSAPVSVPITALINAVIIATGTSLTFMFLMAVAGGGGILFIAPSLRITQGKEMCTRIAELAYAPFKCICNSIENFIENTSTNMKTALVAMTILMGIFSTALNTWMFCGIGFPLSTAVATAYILGFSQSLLFMTIMTVLGNYLIPNRNQQQ